MTIVVIIMILAVAVLTVFGLINPRRQMRFIKVLTTPKGIWSIAAYRVVLGLALLFVAESSKDPGFLEFLGTIILIAGLITPFLGKFIGRVYAWWSVRSPAFLRFASCIGLAFCILIIYAVLPL